jgi:hypothetical protein
MKPGRYERRSPSTPFEYLGFAIQTPPGRYLPSISSYPTTRFHAVRCSAVGSLGQIEDTDPLEHNLTPTVDVSFGTPVILATARGF